MKMLFTRAACISIDYLAKMIPGISGGIHGRLWNLGMRALAKGVGKTVIVKFVIYI